MYGSSNTATRARANGAGSPMAIPAAAAPSTSGRTSSTSPNGHPGTLVLLLAAVAAFVAYALFQHHHNKVRQAVKPSNIAANIHNLAMFTLMLIIVGPLLRVFAAKWKAIGLPGGDTLINIAGNT